MWLLRKLIYPLKYISDKFSNRCDVIVDFIFEDGLFFISIKNISNKPYFKVSVNFEPGIKGIEGTKEIDKLSLFKNIEFLPSHKEIKTLLDKSESYFKREEPTRISTIITYRDRFGYTYRRSIHHDLEIYREIGYIKN